MTASIWPMTATEVKMRCDEAIKQLRACDFKEQFFGTGLLDRLVGLTQRKDQMDAERHRFRSFAERYMIERAKFFAQSKELEEGWQSIEQAKKLYGMIEDASVKMFPEPVPELTSSGWTSSVAQATKAPPPNPGVSPLGKQGWTTSMKGKSP